MTDAPTEPVPETPRCFADGRYRVTEELGSGGMGRVLRARDELLHRDVAVKVLSGDVAADPAARERFLREARAAAAIHDPHVVSVHDVGEEQGLPYLVMECVDGPSLADVLAAAGPLPADEVVDVAVDALVGIDRAHSAGLLHRDIKPGNLLRAPDGTVKVTDFGVVEPIERAEAPNLTRTGFVVGTLHYLPPERRAGSPATVASDLWSLGATLLELLTGRGPSTENRPDTLPPTTPKGLVGLLDHLLADDPAGRPASAMDALALLGGDGGAVTRERPIAALSPGRRSTPRPLDRPHGGDDATEAVRAEGGDPGARRTGGTRWSLVAVAAVLLLVTVVVLRVVTGDDGEVVGGGGPVEVVVDPGDPAGTLRDLAEQLRDRGGS